MLDDILDEMLPESKETKPVKPSKPKPKEPAEPVVSLKRFIELEPQPRYIAVLLELHYKTEARSISNWKQLVSEISSKRTA